MSTPVNHGTGLAHNNNNPSSRSHSRGFATNVEPTQTAVVDASSYAHPPLRVVVATSPSSGLHVPAYSLPPTPLHGGDKQTTPHSWGQPISGAAEKPKWLHVLPIALFFVTVTGLLSVVFYRVAESFLLTSAPTSPFAELNTPRMQGKSRNGHPNEPMGHNVAVVTHSGGANHHHNHHLTSKQHIHRHIANLVEPKRNSTTEDGSYILPHFGYRNMTDYYDYHFWQRMDKQCTAPLDSPLKTGSNWDAPLPLFFSPGEAHKWRLITRPFGDCVAAAAGKELLLDGKPFTSAKAPVCTFQRRYSCRIIQWAATSDFSRSQFQQYFNEQLQSMQQRGIPNFAIGVNRVQISDMNRCDHVPKSGGETAVRSLLLPVFIHKHSKSGQTLTIDPTAISDPLPDVMAARDVRVAFAEKLYKASFQKRVEEHVEYLRTLTMTQLMKAMAHGSMNGENMDICYRGVIDKEKELVNTTTRLTVMFFEGNVDDLYNYGHQEGAHGLLGTVESAVGTNHELTLSPELTALKLYELDTPALRELRSRSPWGDAIRIFKQWFELLPTASDFRQACRPAEDDDLAHPNRIPTNRSVHRVQFRVAHFNHDAASYANVAGVFDRCHKHIWFHSPAYHLRNDQQKDRSDSLLDDSNSVTVDPTLAVTFSNNLRRAALSVILARENVLAFAADYPALDGKPPLNESLVPPDVTGMGAALGTVGLGTLVLRGLFSPITVPSYPVGQAHEVGSAPDTPTTSSALAAVMNHAALPADAAVPIGCTRVFALPSHDCSAKVNEALLHLATHMIQKHGFCVVQDGDAPGIVARNLGKVIRLVQGQQWAELLADTALLMVPSGASMLHTMYWLDPANSPTVVEVAMTDDCSEPPASTFFKTASRHAPETAYWAHASALGHKYAWMPLGSDGPVEDTHRVDRAVAFASP